MFDLPPAPAARVRLQGATAQSEPFTGPAWWQAVLLLIAALAVQTELLHYLNFRGVQPSFVLILVVWYAVRADARRAALFGLLAGLCEDIFSTQTGAAWTLSTTATALVASLASRGFFADSIPAAALAVAIATMLRRLLFWAIMALQGYPAGYASVHFHRTLLEAALNAGLAILAMLAIRYSENRRVR